MISQSYTQTASGLIVPRSNGYANRLFLDQIGSGTRTLPSWAKIAKIALMGSGGSGGAVSTTNMGLQSKVTAGAGGPLILAVLNLEEMGRSFNFVLGKGGDSVTATSSGQANGNPGALSSVVWGARTFTANPGQGGAVSDQTGSALAGPAGGVGVGGDLNFKGGDGGGFPARPNANCAAVPGGGSSGRPQGDGYRGGQVSGSFSGTSPAFAGSAYMLPGASWGGTGDIDPASLSQTNAFGGPGVLGPAYDARPGRGSGTMRTDYKTGDGSGGTSYNTNTLLFTPADPWWDLDDICGWGGGITSAGQNSDLILIPAGPGGGGSSYDAPVGRTLHRHGGFGGGGSGICSGVSSVVAGDGGRGGGGGAAAQLSGGSTGYLARSGRGGDAWLGIWFN